MMPGRSTKMVCLLSILFALNAAPPVMAQKTQSCAIVKIVVHSVSCLACVRRIERHLRQSEGVASVEVASGNEREPLYTVCFNPQKISESAIIQTVAKEGYRYEKVMSKPAAPKE